MGTAILILAGVFIAGLTLGYLWGATRESDQGDLAHDDAWEASRELADLHRSIADGICEGADRQYKEWRHYWMQDITPAKIDQLHDETGLSNRECLLILLTESVISPARAERLRTDLQTARVL